MSKKFKRLNVLKNGQKLTRCKTIIRQILRESWGSKNDLMQRRKKMGDYVLIELIKNCKYRYYCTS